MKTTHEFYTDFRSFLQKRNPEADLSTVAPDTNLFDAGVVDSLNMVHVILFIEEYFGVAVRIEEVELSTFYTMERIYAMFAPDSAHAQVG